MAFAATNDEVPLSDGGALDGASSLRTLAAKLTLRRGTWTAGGATKGTIETGLTQVFISSLKVDAGTITSQFTCKDNVDLDGNALEGAIGILVSAVDNTGTWWALGLE